MSKTSLSIKIFCLAMILLELIGWILYGLVFKVNPTIYVTLYSLIMLIGWVSILFLMNWARLLIIVISILRVSYLVFQFIFAFLKEHEMSVTIIPKILTALFFSFIIWFLTKHSTRVQFHQS